MRTKSVFAQIVFLNEQASPYPGSHRVDQQNFHEGMYDFYDDRGNLLRQIDMHNQIEWELVDDPE
jgi:hypothetical protein